MAVSGNTTFNSTTYDIINDAFIELNAYGPDEEIPSYAFEHAKRVLNRMIKTWMAFDYHLWLKQTAYFFTKKNQNLYTLSSTSTDHATLSYCATTLSSTENAGSNNISVVTDCDMKVGDYIGVVLDDNDIFWSNIRVIIFGDTLYFTIGDELPSQASAGNSVIFYTTQLDSPFNIYSANRSDIFKTVSDVPLNYLSYQEYFEIPNKEDTSSVPVSYNYDRRRDSSIIRIWPTPDRSDIVIKLTLARKIYNFDVNSNDADFPEEWHETIVLNLAMRIAPSLGKNKDSRYQSLVLMANDSLMRTLSFDNEPGSIYFKVK